MTILQLQELALACLRRLAVLAVSVVLAFVSLLPVGTGGWVVAAAPMAALGVLVFWMLARPEEVSAGSMFLSGLIFDAFGGGPLGLWALSFLVACVAARLQRDDILMMPRLVVLVVYGTVAGLAALTAWGTATVYVQGLVDPTPLIAGGIVSAGVFLAASLVFGSRVATPGRYLGHG
jgi:rod shape-determining protein MreD